MYLHNYTYLISQGCLRSELPIIQISMETHISETQNIINVYDSLQELLNS